METSFLAQTELQVYLQKSIWIHLHEITKKALFNSITMFIKTEAHIESMPSGWRGLFALCLYSNMSFMQSFTETLCVVHFGPVCRADRRHGRLLSSPIHFSTSRPVLLIIKPDYENTLESQNALTISNINKKIWQKGHWQHSANGGLNSVAEWIKGYCIICLYFIILFAGLFYKLFPESAPKCGCVLLGGWLHVFLVYFMLVQSK